MKSLNLLKSYRTFGSGHGTYGLNSQGYRCPEFNQIEWENSILLFGCSIAFGIGLNDSETVGHHLSNISNIPIINLAQGGSAYLYQWTNSTIIRKNGIMPKAVIYIWPEESRQTIFDSTDYLSTISINIWNVKNPPNYEDPGISLVLDPYHPNAVAKHIRDNLNLIWTCPILHYSFTSTNMDVIHLPPKIDRARDDAHPGIKTTVLWANIIAKDLIKNNILPP